MLVRVWSNRNPQSLLMGMQNSTATMKDILEISYKTIHSLYMQSSKCASLYLPKNSWKLTSTQPAHVCLQQFFITVKSWRQPRYPSAGECVNEQWHIQQGNVVQCSKSVHWIAHENVWRKSEHMTKCKTSVQKTYIFYDSNYMTFWKRKNYGDGKRTNSFQWLGVREGWIGRVERILWQYIYSKWLYNSGYISLHIFWNPQKHTSGVSSSVNYWLGQ